MTSTSAYTYVLLRYRHDPLTGEFANVGVVLHQPSSGFLDAKIRHTLGRLSKMFPDLNGHALKSSLVSLESAIKRLARTEAGDLLASLKDAKSFARRALPDDDTSFVWGPVGSGIDEDPANALEAIYHRFVALYDEPHPRHRDDATVWKPVRERLTELDLEDELQPKTITSPVDKVEFPHAWKNGEWHCYQPVSFDLANEDNIRDKARRWVGHMATLKDPSEPFKPYFFIGAPGDKGLSAAYQAAIGILEVNEVGAEIIEETNIDDLVQQIVRDIKAQ